MSIESAIAIGIICGLLGYVAMKIYDMARLQAYQTRLLTSICSHLEQPGRDHMAAIVREYQRDKS